MSNYAGNYGGPGPISMMSGTIIPSNNNQIGSAPVPRHHHRRAQPLRERELGAGEDRLDHRWNVEHRADQRAATGYSVPYPSTIGRGRQQFQSLLDPQRDSQQRG